jgi:YHS domain-containing protein
MSFNLGKISRVALAIFMVVSFNLPGRSAAAAVDPINKNFFGTALKGYDAVAYFKEGRAVKGKSEFRRDWLGAKWYFANAENRDEFAKNPDKYAPQFGGYCAWAVGHGYTANIDPEAWKIVDGKLYLNYDKSVQRMWEQDISGWIKKANENWPKLKK